VVRLAAIENLPENLLRLKSASPKAILDANWLMCHRVRSTAAARCDAVSNIRAFHVRAHLEQTIGVTHA
jgi:hypothetical protein